MKYKDIYGNTLKKISCNKCNKDITGITHHRKGFCLGCAVAVGLIK